jgi:hypothetical protein
MAVFHSESRGLLPHLGGDDWRGRSFLSRREEPWEPSTRWAVAGLVVLGLGALAWYYLGPDVRRYLKIHSM